MAAQMPVLLEIKRLKMEIERLESENKRLKTKLPHIVVVSNDDDWNGLYVNGKLKQENHSIIAYDILEALKKRGVITYERVTCDNDWLEEVGCRLPQNLEDVKRA